MQLTAHSFLYIVEKELILNLLLTKNFLFNSKDK